MPLSGKLPGVTDFEQQISDKSRPISFHRNVGLFGAVTLGVGSLMGAGLYVLVGIAAAEAGPGLWIAYAVCGLLTFLTAAMYSELSKAMPISGGGYLYAYSRLGSFWGFLVGWHLAVGSIFACALYAYGFGSYLTAFVPLKTVPLLFIRAAGIGLVLILTAAALRGGKGGTHLQTVFTWGNLIVVFALILMGLIGFDTDHFSPMLPNGLSGVGGAVSLIYISFFGYQLVANTSEEIKNPEKTVPKAMFLSLCIAGVFYLLTAVVAVGAVPWNELAASNAPLALVAERAVGKPGIFLIGLGALLASVAALNGTLVSQARQIFAMGRDRIVPEFLGTVSQKAGVPAAALVAGASVTIVVLIFADVTFVAKAANFSLLFSMLPLSFALSSLQKERIASGETISLWKRSIPFAALVAAVGLLLTLDMQALTFGGTIIGISCIVFFTYSYSAEKRGRAGFSIHLSDDVPSGFRFGGEKILVPMANPKTQAHLLNLAESLALAQDAEITVLSVIVADKGQKPREVLSKNSRIGDAVQVLSGAARAAEAENTAFTPMVRAARSLAEGILHAVEDERAKLLVMGWSADKDGTPTQLIDTILRTCRSNLAFLHMKEAPSPGLVKYRNIGVALSTQGNGALMGQLAAAMTAENNSRITYFSVLPPYCDKADLVRTRALHMAAIDRHDSHVPYTAEFIQADNPRQAIVDKTKELDLLIIGAGSPKSTGGETVGTFTGLIAERAHCSVILVRREKRLPSFIPRTFAKEMPDATEAL